MAKLTQYAYLNYKWYIYDSKGLDQSSRPTVTSCNCFRCILKIILSLWHKLAELL